MAQSNFTVANVARPLALAQINQAIIALATKSSGSTAPTTTYPYQDWVDTTTGLYKVRNADNTGWITIGPISEENLGLASAEKTTQLAHSWQGNGVLNTRSFSFPATSKVVEFECRGSDLSPQTAAGIMVTITTGDLAGDTTGNIFLFQPGDGSVFSGQNTFQGTTPPKELALFAFGGALETISCKGQITITPNGRAVLQVENFRIGAQVGEAFTAQSVRRQAWTNPAPAQNLDNLTINCYQSSNGARIPFPTGFSIRLYSKGQ